MHIVGSNLKITASPSAWFDALGSQYWDDLGYYGGHEKPMFAMIEVKYSTLIGLKVRNTPAHAFMIACSEHSTFQNFKVDDSAGDLTPGRKAKNTDGIHILQSTAITVVGAEIINQDDCVCITSGFDVNITAITCLGGGLSVGSVGKNTNANEVTKVIFSQSTITNSLYGVLVKTWVGGHGLVDQVTFEDISLKDIRMYGVAISQGYTNEGITAAPTDGVPITNLILRNVIGNVSPGAQRVLVRCGSSKSCLRFFWTVVKFSGGEPSKGNLNVPDGAR
uniref:endo-polygalacturonase n=1 Tax=Albugo laibachii Nc14 TaxID=890382 RepID=F0WCZ9_9STRA|nr:unnamed protein product [Albugo laibachii Nc14]|eukprot:CCA19070.1 unnamed protein product [Albugo laibachii Nc14]